MSEQYFNSNSSINSLIVYAINYTLASISKNSIDENNSKTLSPIVSNALFGYQNRIYNVSIQYHRQINVQDIQPLSMYVEKLTVRSIKQTEVPLAAKTHFCGKAW